MGAEISHLPRRVVCLSPHLDDAVLSAGATLHDLVRQGSQVVVATVFAGDPVDGRAASSWDEMRGVTTAAEAAEARRREDTLACERLGVDRQWGDFLDSSYLGARDHASIAQFVRDAVKGSDVVLVPGWPLTHEDHEYVCRVAVEALSGIVPLVFYTEEPYASRFPHVLTSLRPSARVDVGVLGSRSPQSRPRWVSIRSSRQAHAAKRVACAAYEGELRLLGWRHTVAAGIGALARAEVLGSRDVDLTRCLGSGRESRCR